MEEYLNEVHHEFLDFDAEPICCETLANSNIFCCLTCGKYFSGSSKGSPAYWHSTSGMSALDSIDEVEFYKHRIFMELTTGLCHLLPEGISANHPDLQKLSKALIPSYTLETVARLTIPAGIHSIRNSDYIICIVQLLTSINVIRDILLMEDDYSGTLPLLAATKRLIRKSWNPNRLQSQIYLAPNEFLHAVDASSNGKFTSLSQGDPSAFLTWFTHQLTMGSPTLKQAIDGHLQGRLHLYTINSANQVLADRQVNFKHLTLKLPPMPLFKERNTRGDSIITPSVHINSLLSIYEGTSWEYSADGSTRSRYILEAIPEYLILYIKRFERVHGILAKNSTQLVFPLHSLPIHGEKYDLVGAVAHKGVDLPEASAFPEERKQSIRTDSGLGINRAVSAQSTLQLVTDGSRGDSDDSHFVTFSRLHKKGWYKMTNDGKPLQELLDTSLINSSDMCILVYHKQ